MDGGDTGSLYTDLPGPVTIQGSTFTPSGSIYIIGSQTLNPGSIIQVSRTPLSLAPDASTLAIGATTVPLNQSPDTPMATITPAPSLPGSADIGNAQSGIVRGSQTVSLGGPVVIISGTPYSVAPSTIAVIVGTSTIAFQLARTPPAITVGGSIIMANS